jgi:thioredoxin reductase (NADPH)
MKIIDAEIAIIGAGPVGIELAIALKKSGISFLQFDRGQIAQTIFEFPVQTHFFSSPERIAIAGTPIQTLDQQKCTREEYLAYLRTCVMTHGLHVHSFEEVVAVHKKDTKETFEIETLSSSGKHLYEVNYIVFSTGGTAYSRVMGIPGEDLHHVSTKMNDPHLYFQKDVVIVGSRNSAIEWSLRCYHAGARVTLVCRREAFDTDHVKYWLLPEFTGLVKAGYIDCLFSSEVVEITPDKVIIRAVDGTLTEKKADFVIKAIGFSCDSSLMQRSGVIIKENDIPLFDNQTMETSIANMFVMGTATGGTQMNYKVFIENCHEHINRIIETISARLGRIPDLNAANEQQKDLNRSPEE